MQEGRKLMAKKTRQEIEAERAQLAADEAAFSQEDAGRQADEIAAQQREGDRRVTQGSARPLSDDDLAPHVHELALSINWFARCKATVDLLDSAVSEHERERRRVAEYVRRQHDENGNPRLHGDPVR